MKKKTIYCEYCGGKMVTNEDDCKYSVYTGKPTYGAICINYGQDLPAKREKYRKRHMKLAKERYETDNFSRKNISLLDRLIGIEPYDLEDYYIEPIFEYSDHDKLSPSEVADLLANK